MGRSTKKVGGAGRYGPRYGVKIRRQIEDIEKKKRMKHPCPNCGHNAVKRLSPGIWHCRHCDLKFAGGAYIPVSARKGVLAPKEETEKAVPAEEEGAEEDV
ncbi:MAG: 50S ribosomal protein L37ae [Thermoplasmata archaeon]|nr:50S ribosomal protein L37ae [Thermoplasmata archaeon]